MERGLEPRVDAARSPRSVSTPGAWTTGCSTRRRARRAAVLLPRRRGPSASGDVVERDRRSGCTRISGVQLSPINTIFQLAAHDPDELARAAARADAARSCSSHHLTGVVTGERTSAGTTGLVDVRHARLVGRALRRHRRRSAHSCPTSNRRDTRPARGAACRSTSSAATTPRRRWWHGRGRRRRVRLERHMVARRPRTTATGHVRRSADREIQQRARRARWRPFPSQRRRLVAGRPVPTTCGAGTDTARLLAAAALVDGDMPTFDVTDPRFLAPADMVAELRDASGLADADPATLVRCTVESMAASDRDRRRRPASGHRRTRLRRWLAVARCYLDALRRRTGLP